MFLTAALLAFLHTCAPTVAPRTMAALVQHESRWHPYSIDDDTTGQSFFFSDAADATVAELHLLARGDQVDVGLAQVDSENLGEYDLPATSAFDPCQNLRAGAAILTRAYATALHTNWLGHPILTRTDRYNEEQFALIHALSAYNSGRAWGALRYAATVYHLAAVTTTAQLAPHVHPTPAPQRTFWVYHQP